MKKQEFLQHIVNRLESGENDSLKMSLNNVHAQGLFSLVVDGSEAGKLTRIFIADKKLKPYGVQLHTHRYPIRLTAIKGSIKQYSASEVNYPDGHTVELSRYGYKSFLNGGKGLMYHSDRNYRVDEFTVPVGGTINMNTEEFHTISCSKGSMWIVEELGFDKDESLVLGVPFVVDALYTEPKQFQINDKVQAVIMVLKDMISDYNRV
ncbi:hypothetical protein [Pedobacter sp. B4-66]|uniref:hypothetical protein n=1 Tax=Pedobacter sp. B4-66 TaxID=2817280 RepID=UPI001BDB56DA|nr:hypothetical protein [Pedobacter sp. B4-66]